MKTISKILTFALVLLFAACNNNDEYDMLNSLWRNVTQNEARIGNIEKWCSQANTNITSLQTIVNVIESNDVVTSVTPIMEGEVEVGYTITFAGHDPITIYHGKDGKDGANGQDGVNGINGTDGQDGFTPIVGVRQDTDGVYYWTLNGEWLLDDAGNKLRVSGKDGADGANGNDGQDGKDGANGSDGQNGQDGVDGQDGVTPKLKIEADYWWISYDNGITWTQLGKAKGEDGTDGVNGSQGEKGDKGEKGDTGADGAQGEKGDKGDTGDSMFQSVTQDASNVYFTLADGTVITIAKNGSGNADDGNLFTVTYMPNGGKGTAVVEKVRYGCSYTIKSCTFTSADRIFDIWNTSSDGTGVSYAPDENIMVTKNIILYGLWADMAHDYVDLGLSVKWATCNIGSSDPEGYGDYFAWGETEPKTTYFYGTYKWCNGSLSTLTKYNTSSSRGTVDNKTVLELADDAAHVNWGGAWRMPTDAEWTELRENCTWTWTTLNDVNGYEVKSKTNGNSIFLPAAGYRSGSVLYDAGDYGHYWSSLLDTDDPTYALYVYFRSGGVGWSKLDRYRSYGRSVRPVRPVLE